MSEKIKVVTLGCDKNLVDSEIMSGLIDERGYILVDDDDEATVIIVNTCGFIDAAKEESVNAILDLAQLKDSANLKALIVSGCLTQRYKDELMNEMPEIDGIVGTGDFHKINTIIDEALAGSKPCYVGKPAFDYERPLPRRTATPRHTAFVKIAEGCDHACTFCSIPLMRGSFRSRSIESIIREVESLAAEGVREISLIAQDTTNYGSDLYGRLALPELIQRLSEIQGIDWIRLQYAYPGLFTEELIAVIASNPKVCKYIDMPLQHSEESILKRMRRPGHGRDARQLLADIRRRIPGVALRTSLIVGFPGETEADFAELKRFVEEIGFDRLGVFKYSREEDTPAARLPFQIEEDVKEARANELMELQRTISNKRNWNRIGQEMDVLLERYDDDNDMFVGRSQFDAPEVDSEVFVASCDGKIGDIVKVRVTHSFEFDLAGEEIA